MAYEFIVVEKREKLTVVTINRPEVMNAMHLPACQELDKAFNDFSQDPEALQLTCKAAHLLGASEDALYGSRWATQAQVAVLKPETTQRWMNLSGNPPHLMAAWSSRCC